MSHSVPSARGVKEEKDGGATSAVPHLGTRVDAECGDKALEEIEEGTGRAEGVLREGALGRPVGDELDKGRAGQFLRDGLLGGREGLGDGRCLDVGGLVSR